MAKTATTNPSLVNDKITLRKKNWTTDNNFIISDSAGISFLEDLYENGLEYTAESKIDISVGDRGVYINDGVNPIHMVSVDSRSNIIPSWVGIKSPQNKPRITTEVFNKQFDNTNSGISYEEGSGSGLGGIGLIRCQYTVVSATGQESNPSPASDFINAQFFKIASDGISDERLIKSISIRDLNIPLVPDAVTEALKYFKVYYQIIRYSEGVDIDTMEFSVQVDIKNKETSATTTGNDYTISNIKSSGETISYENDTGFPCKVSATNAGVLMVGGIKKAANIPGDFQYMTPISINNQNQTTVVDAVVKINLRRGDIKNKDGEVIFPSFSRFFKRTSGVKWVRYSSVLDADYPSRHLRIYDNDMTTPIMVYMPKAWSHNGDNQNIDIYVKIPLLGAGENHTIFFCWNDLSSSNRTQAMNENPVLISGHQGVVDSYNDIVADKYDWNNNIGVHYGRWVLSDDDTNLAQNRQQVFQERRVATAATEILAMPHINDLGLPNDGKDGYDLANLANTNCHGEATTENDPHIVQKTCMPPDSSNLTLKNVGDDGIEIGGWNPGDKDEITSYSESNASYWLMQNRFYDYEEKNEINVTSYQKQAYDLTKLLGFNKHTSIVMPLYRLRSEGIDEEGNLIGDGDTDLAEEDLSVASVITNPDNSRDELRNDEGELVGDAGQQYSGYCTSVNSSTRGFTYRTRGNCSGNGIWTDWTELYDDWDANRGQGYIRGLAPITSLGSHGENLDNYVLKSDKSHTHSDNGAVFPRDYDKINQTLVLNRLTPYLSGANKVNDYFQNKVAKDVNNYYSIGAFKPFCGGWSFRKSAVNIGNIPDKGYMYTNIAFRTADLQTADETTTLRPTGADPYNVESQTYYYQNSLFYVSCGSINDIDAEPNHPLKFDPYPESSEWTKADQIGHTGAVEYIDAHYNADNFRPTSEAGADPGAITITEEGDGTNANVPSNGNVETHGHAGTRDEDITPDNDVVTNTNPLTNLFFVHIYKYEVEDINGILIDTHYRFRLFVRTAAGYDAHLDIYLNELKGDPSTDVQNYFVYLSWDLENEKFTLACKQTDRGNTLPKAKFRVVERDYSEETLRLRDGLRNKPLFDIGLGNSTYLNRIVSSDNEHQRFNLSGYHGVYGTTEMTTGVYSKDEHFIQCLIENAPRLATPVGFDYDRSIDNNNITIKDTIQRTEKSYDNMIMWSEVNKDALPDLNYKLMKEPVIKILSAPSFLKFEYSNTFLIFTRNTISRFVLKGTATGWSGSSESLIEEQIQYGLYAPDSLTKVGGEILWLSEEGVIRWNTEGLQNISGNVISIPLVDTMRGFYCSVNNQYMLHDNVDNMTYVYDLVYRRWTTFKGFDVLSSSLLTGGENIENINIFLTSNSKINQYPTSTKTSDSAHIKTKDMMMESASINRVKLDYNGDTAADLTYTIRNVKSDGTDVERTKKITGIEKNVWRGTGKVGRKYGREANIKIEDADEIYKILYDLSVRGGE